MRARLSFAYPDDHVSPDTIPALLDLPTLDAPLAEHTLAQARYKRIGDVVVPLSEEGAIALCASRLVRLARIDRVRQWGQLTRRASREVAPGVPVAAVLPRTWPTERPLMAPPWSGSAWLKSAFSTLSLGVEQVMDARQADLEQAAERISRRARPHHELVERLTGQDPARRWLLQEHVDGPQFEANLALADGEVLRGPVLRQHWEGDKIMLYEPAEEPELSALTLGLARILGARWTFVCAEWRRSPAGWRLIELHLRPGDDPASKGYPAAQWVPQAVRWMLRAWE